MPEHLEGVKEGHLLVVVARNGKSHAEQVVKVARVWVTLRSGDQFRIGTGAGKTEWDGRAYTEAQHALNTEMAKLRSKLTDWGWHPASCGKILTVAQMRRVAALLREFEKTDGVSSRPTVQDGDEAFLSWWETADFGSSMEPVAGVIFEAGWKARDAWTEGPS